MEVTVATGGIKVFGLVGYGNEGVFADMERADDMVEVVVGADILVFAIDLLASGIKDLEGNTCDARLRGGGAQGGVGFQVGGDRNVKARKGHVHSSGFKLCGGRGVLVGGAGEEGRQGKEQKCVGYSHCFKL